MTNIYEDKNMRVYETGQNYDFIFIIELNDDLIGYIEFPNYNTTMEIKSWIGILNKDKCLIDEILKGNFNYFNKKEN